LHDRDWTGRYVWLVRDATGEADRLPRDGRAMSILDLSGGERSSESGMQHLSLLHSERELAFSRVLTPPVGETRRRISNVGGVAMVVSRDARLRS
jgi:hypothetical protein